MFNLLTQADDFMLLTCFNVCTSSLLKQFVNIVDLSPPQGFYSLNWLIFTLLNPTFEPCAFILFIYLRIIEIIPSPILMSSPSVFSGCIISCICAEETN